MAIEKSNVKVAVSRMDTEFLIGSKSRESMSSDGDELCPKNSVDSEDDDEFDDADSGAGSDDFDLLELGETGSEFCQVGDQTCCIPFELYDLPDLHGILSLEVWNECLTEEERFSLTKYLPDMDQEIFMRTLKELFDGGNIHFGNPIDMLYGMLKGGLCEPRVALYRQGLNFFQLHQHYHFLHNRQDSMVASFLQMRDAWQKCKGYGIEEKLRVLNIIRSRKRLTGEKNVGVGSDSSEMEESAEAISNLRSKGRSSVSKVVCQPLYGTSPAVDVFSRGGKLAAEGKPNSRLLMAGSKSPLQSELVPRFRHGHQSIKTGSYGPDSVIPRGGKAAAYNDEQERIYEMASQRDANVAQGNKIDSVQAMKRGKKRIAPGGGEYDIDSYSPALHSAKTKFSGHGRDLNINQLSDIKVLTAKPSNVRGFYDPAKRAKYGMPTYEDQMGPLKGRPAQMAMKGNMGNYAEPYWSKKTPRQAYFMDPSFNYADKDVDSRKINMGKEVPNSRFKTPQSVGNSRVDDRNYLHGKQSKVFQDNIRGGTLWNEGSSMFSLKNERMFHGGEDTESDSSDQPEEKEKNHLIMPNRGMHGYLEAPRSSLYGSAIDKKEKQAKRSVKGNVVAFEGVMPSPGTIGDLARRLQGQEIDNYYLKTRQSGKTQHLDVPQDFTSRFPENCYYGDLGNTNVDTNRISSYVLGRNGQVQGLPVPMNSAFPFERRLRENVGYDTLSRKSNYMQDYSMQENEVRFEDSPIRRDNRRFDASLIGCTSTGKKYKRKEGLTEMDEQVGSDYMHSHQPVFESISLKHRGRKRREENGSPCAGPSEQPIVEVVVEDLEPEIKPPKKPSPPITPTIHTGFSFSVIHLLSAVRVSLITPSTVDSSEAQKNLETLAAGTIDQNGKQEQTNGSSEQIDVNNPANPEQTSIPSLTVHEIVNRVKSNPGDPKILETPEPLHELVRGVLKVFASKTAPLGAKGWKPLISYDKSTKCWSWTGPGPQTPTDDEPIEEVISPEAWRIPRKMLVKLVDSFANWLKCGQETLQQIGSLPAPPAELMELNFDEKERFKDLRAQKSLPTFSPSTDEVRAYFRKEEHLRYSVPDRAFNYTAADGKKSIVAPLRRCGGKPTSKARDHFMLKPDRPPHVTILCLVRDAAARLPGSIGTRADVCTLIRDSQYVVEDVSDAQVNQVVSGALDRLHYERDPCVQFDGERKLWVYLHRVREEEDFEDDGTSSTKKWKRQKKDASEQDDQVTIASADNTEPTGLDPTSDLNVDLSCMNDDAKEKLEGEAKANHMPEQGATIESGSHCLENKNEENSKNKDFDDGT
ncbi:uncharacterized protein LOC141591422 [Silene latifolia]|uniref:uncharacterized protein LOC141591422 n=1 Tax=Silene latifolia TaxID=37657 RepID=UPI003D786F70